MCTCMQIWEITAVRSNVQSDVQNSTPYAKIIGRTVDQGEESCSITACNVCVFCGDHYACLNKLSIFKQIIQYQQEGGHCFGKQGYITDTGYCQPVWVLLTLYQAHHLHIHCLLLFFDSRPLTFGYPHSCSDFRLHFCPSLIYFLIHLTFYGQLRQSERFVSHYLTKTVSTVANLKSTIFLFQKNAFSDQDSKQDRRLVQVDAEMPG